MADLSRDDVLQLAQLAKLKLSEEEIAQFQKELAEILDYVEKISEVDVTGLQPTTQVTGLTNVTRNDVVRQYQADQQALLKNLPDRQGNSIKVRRVL
jgi:aspartyl-tRNA(Asn)/glutamyl-tRNA(Gln) amidotransferase subunit C